MKMYWCTRCHKEHGPEQIYGVESRYCRECIKEMGGYTLDDLKTSGIAAYMPYIPLYVTPLPIEEDFSI